MHFSSEWAEKNGIKLTKPGILENRIKDWIIHQFTDNIPGIKASFIASGDGSFIVFVSSENGSLPSDELQDLVDEGYANGAEILAFKGEPSVP